MARSRPRAWVRGFDLLGHAFPGLHVASLIALAYAVVATRSPWIFAALVLCPYVIPLTLFRVCNAIAPIREGGSVLAKGIWSTWFISYRLQVIYAYFPFLEGALLAFPGLFNLWLRAWGSRVGKGVVWAATAQVTDRGHLDIGDNVTFGNAVYLSPHVVQRRKGRTVLYMKRIRIGADAFIGAGVRMGPGASVPAGSLVPLLTDLYVNQTFASEQTS